MRLAFFFRKICLRADLPKPLRAPFPVVQNNGVQRREEFFRLFAGKVRAVGAEIPLSFLYTDADGAAFDAAARGILPAAAAGPPRYSVPIFADAPAPSGGIPCFPQGYGHPENRNTLQNIQAVWKLFPLWRRLSGQDRYGTSASRAQCRAAILRGAIFSPFRLSYSAQIKNSIPFLIYFFNLSA